MKTIIEKPWGHEEIIIHTDRYIMKKIFIEAASPTDPPRQFHIKKDKTIYVNDGVLHLDFSRENSESNVRKLDEGESCRILPKTIHRFCAPPDVNVELIEVSTPELDDVVRLHDNHGRLDRA